MNIATDHLHCDDNLAGHAFQNHYFKPKPIKAAEHEAAIYRYIQKQGNIDL